MKITAARVLGMVALIIDRAEACLAQGGDPSEAIDRALWEHDQDPAEVEAAARTVWRTMLVGHEADPLAREMFRDTLARLGLFAPVRQEMIRTCKAQPKVVDRLRNVLSFCRARDVPAMLEAVEGFHAYASFVHDATGTRPAPHELVAALLASPRRD